MQVALGRRARRRDLFFWVGHGVTLSTLLACRPETTGKLSHKPQTPAPWPRRLVEEQLYRLLLETKWVDRNRTRPPRPDGTNFSPWPPRTHRLVGLTLNDDTNNADVNASWSQGGAKQDKGHYVATTEMLYQRQLKQSGKLPKVIPTSN